MWTAWAIPCRIAAGRQPATSAAIVRLNGCLRTRDNVASTYQFLARGTCAGRCQHGLHFATF
jgi:hypothetical protein